MEVVFETDAGPSGGLKLIGFAVWERRHVPEFHLGLTRLEYQKGVGTPV